MVSKLSRTLNILNLKVEKYVELLIEVNCIILSKTLRLKKIHDSSNLSKSVNISEKISESYTIII